VPGRMCAAGPRMSSALGAIGQRQARSRPCHRHSYSPTLAASGAAVDALGKRRTDLSMRPSRLRPIAILLAVTTLIPVVGVSPASALTLQRTWWAHFGTSGVNGSLAIRAYTNGSGSATYNLKGLRANSNYSVAIRNGTCSKLGTVVARLPVIHTTSR